ncbi:MAG: NAD(P)H-dependent glycerol-3-phosphate dehydrogenase [Nanoarchaeota archaeon]|nr:NAD(P)-dependent glycerol-3-phosphate dehydrogenase [Nanoarchaeota archaeon]MBU1632742.1 NAD(P)-dependent glycerol-3-phosphate dehydrogenase [Nanoarchaeota archaeon]MBU1876658.1 NAD(P)-dependent glycerol-3-phosphate dehydrogenase [Nanoarchaeota archaeon]
MKIAILGGGSWGSALAVHLARKDNEVKIWEFFAEQAEEMQEKRFCKLLPEARLPENIFVSSMMEEVLPMSELVLIVVPSDKVEITIDSAKRYLSNQPLIICSKGFANGKLLSDAIKEKVPNNIYCLYGPTHAEEVCKDMLSGIVLAGPPSEERDKIKNVIHSHHLRVDLSDDLIGVQVSAALKNILAVFIGFLDGKKMGDNTKAFVITKGLEEIKRIGNKLGAQEDTFCGLAGIGDIIVTCTSKHSRNRYFGEQIGKGRSASDIIEEMSMIVEGVTALEKAIDLNVKLALDLPLITGLYKIIFKSKSLDEVL